MQPQGPTKNQVPWTGTTHGIAQAAVVALVLLFESCNSDPAVVVWRDRPFWFLLTVSVVTPVALGLVVDFRRRGSPVRFVAPGVVRAGLVLGAIVVGSAVLDTVVARVLPTIIRVVLWMLSSLCAFVVLDRIVGPAWFVVRAARSRATPRREVPSRSPSPAPQDRLGSTALIALVAGLFWLAVPLLVRAGSDLSIRYEHNDGS